MIVKYLFGVKGSEILSNQSICSTDFMNIELPFNKDNFIRSNISRAKNSIILQKGIIMILLIPLECIKKLY